MEPGDGTEYVAECFWPGVTQEELDSLDERARTAASASSALPARYLGSILMREDEVVLCRFEGTEDAVRALAERAAVPFERIVEATTPRPPDEGRR